MGVMETLFGSGTGLDAGDRAPDFALPDQDGQVVRLGELLGKRAVVVYFYPKDDTPGCTKESCAFRDQFEAFTDAGAEVLGISSDPPASHAAFAAKYRLPFRLLSDESGEVRRAYRVPKSLGLIPGRVTYVIDREGMIRHAFNSQTRPTEHVEEALRVLEGLR